MKVVFFVLGIIFLLLILLILLRPTFKIMMVLSERTRSAYYSIKGAGLSLTKGKVILLSSGEISIVDKKSILLSKRIPKKLSKILAKNMVDKIGIESFEVFVSGGKKDNPYLTATISGVLSAIFSAAGAVSSFRGTKSDFDVRTDFKGNKITVGVISKIKISLLSMIVEGHRSIWQYKKELKMEEEYGKAKTIQGR